MTNAEKFKTPEERARAYQKFCSATGIGCNKCPLKKVSTMQCPFEWLDLEYKEEPKPCPFCGGNDICVYNYEEGYKYAACCGCGCRTDIQKTDEMAIAAWNRRAT